MMDLFSYNSEFSVGFNVFANALVLAGIVTVATVALVVANRVHDWWVIGK